MSGLEQAGGWTTTRRPFVVAVEFEGDDTESMALALMRYETAVLEVVLRPPPAAPMHAVLWAGTTPGDIFQLGQGAAYRSWVEMTFIAKVFEEHLT